MNSSADNIHFLVLDDCWFSAPVERTQHFLPVFAQVSRSVHQALRDVLPSILFRDIARFENVVDGYTMLMYRASRPCRAVTELNYDVLNRTMMTRFFRLASRRFEEVLGEMHEFLIRIGREDLAKLYDPRRAEKIMKMIRTQRRFRRPLHQMLVNEGRLVTELMRLGGCSQCPDKVQIKRAAMFIKSWNLILRRFYAKRDFTEAAEELLYSATLALKAAREPRAPGGGRLRWAA